MDFSLPAEAAARWTARHFAPGAEIVLVHVIAVPKPPRFFSGRFPPRETVIETARAGADKRMRELSGSLGADRIWIEIREGGGDPAEQLAAVATEYSADVIVVGPHGARPGIWDRPGGTAEKLLRHSRAPVLLATAPGDAAPRQLLVPIDDSGVTGTILDWARFLAEPTEAELTIIHVVSSTMLNDLLSAGAVVSGVMVPIPDEVLASAELDAGNWLQRTVAEASLERPGVNTQVIAGDPAHEIIASAERLGSDMIVMGSSAGGLRAALLGSVAREVLRAAKRPVLVLRGGE